VWFRSWRCDQKMRHRTVCQQLEGPADEPITEGVVIALTAFHLLLLQSSFPFCLSPSQLAPLRLLCEEAFNSSLVSDELSHKIRHIFRKPSAYIVDGAW
jgi:hypothetical protein